MRKKTKIIEYSSAFFPKEFFRSLLERHFGSRAKIEEKQSLLLPLLPLLRNNDSYFFCVTPENSFDARADVAFLRHVHKLALGYPKYYLHSESLFKAALSAYELLWRVLFYNDNQKP